MHLLPPKSAGLAVLLFLPAAAFAQLTLTGTSYTQNFDNLGTSLPSDWTVRTGATASSLGTSATFTTASSTWANTTGDFKNLASATGLSSGSTTLAQNNSTNRALGIRQAGSFGDPGASFNFNFNSTGLTLSSLSVDLQLLSPQGYSTTWSLQYATGASPSSWTTFATYSDPGTFGSTTITASSGALSGMSNQNNVWFRAVALSASTGSGSRDTFALDNFNLTFAASAIPEPSSYAAICGAVALAGAIVRRRRSAG